MNYLLYGCEAYNLKKRRDEIINKVLGKDTDMAVSIYRDEDKYIAVNDVIDDCTMFPMFSEHKVVIYENPIFMKEGKKKGSISDENSDDKANKQDNKTMDILLDYLQNPNETTTFIIYCERNISGASSAVKKLAKYMIPEDFKPVDEKTFQNIIRSDLNEAKIRLDYKAQNELFNRLPLNIENWKRELDKLKLYPEKIDVEVIKSLIAKPLEDNVLNLSNAVVNKKLALALSIYHDLLENNKYIVPSLIGLLASQFRFMAQVKALYEHNFNMRDMLEELEVSSDYRIRMTMENCQGKSSVQLLEILNNLSKLDQDIKTGRIDAITGLELFITKTIEG